MIHHVNSKWPEPAQRGFSCLLIFFFFLGSASAQEHYQTLITDGEVQTVNADGERFADYRIPEHPDFDQLILEAVGADGGWIEYQYLDHFGALRSKRVSGGEGATVTATYSIGYGGSIPPGAILRFVIGNRGHWAKYDLLTHGGYGAGGQHHQQMMADGGMQGSGGQSYQKTGGGGGAFKDGAHSEGELIHGNAGWKDFRLNEQPLGGLGGILQEGHRGGWGFGGGGSGLEGGGGGGGGSYVNQSGIFPTNVEKVENGNTSNTGDGFIRYKCVKN